MSICVIVQWWWLRAINHTGWRRPIWCFKLQVNFRKRATCYRALLQEMTCKDKASDDSTPTCMSMRCPLTHMSNELVWIWSRFRTQWEKSNALVVGTVPLHRVARLVWSRSKCAHSFLIQSDLESDERNKTTATHCNTLQHTTLQCVVICCSVL